MLDIIVIRDSLIAASVPPSAQLLIALENLRMGRSQYLASNHSSSVGAIVL